MACPPFIEGTTTFSARDDPDTSPRNLPCQSSTSLKQETAVPGGDIKEYRSSEKRWRGSGGDWDIGRAAEESQGARDRAVSGAYDVRFKGYANEVSPVKV